MYLRSISHPEHFQGQNRSIHQPYFEGWYFKHVSLNGEHTISLIPGISYNHGDAHAFIQILILPEHQTHYIRFKIEEFSYATDAFFVKIGNNTFAGDEINIDLQTPEITLKGKVTYHHVRPISKNALFPSIMGPFAYLPKMQCYHGIISMDHTIRGDLFLNGEPLFLNGGKGYIEKDWGTSFPTNYIWMQSNHFTNKTMSFVLSVATIPYLGQSFEGFFINLQYDNKEVRMATYTGAKIVEKRMTAHEVNLTVEQGPFLLTIQAIRDESHVGTLIAPQKGKMNKTIKEGLTGTIHLTYTDGNEMVIFEDTGLEAGIEIVEKLEQLP